jgi:hypothetical protein
MKGRLVNKQKVQPGFVHLAAVIILVIVLIGALGFVCYRNFTQNKVLVKETDNSSEDSAKEKATPTETENSSGSKTEPTAATKSEYITELAANITFPADYTITKSQEENRFGSYSSYGFNIKQYKAIRLGEIRFYSNASVERFFENNSEPSPLPPEGFYFSPDVFSALRAAYTRGEDYTIRSIKYEYMNLNDQKWLVATHDYSWMKAGYLREYLKSIGNGDNILGVYIDMGGNLGGGLDEKGADELFSHLKFN